jgi:hypothetical protein
MVKGKRRSIFIGEQEFKTKKALEDYIRAIVNSTPDNTPIPSPDHDFLVPFFQTLHNQWDVKKGLGVKHFEVRWVYTSQGKSRGVHIVRTDESVIDISWKRILEKPSHYADVLDAARLEVAAQRNDFSDAFFKGNKEPKCQVTQVPITKKESQVDHAAPLTHKALVDAWLVAGGIATNDIKLEDLGVESRFTDRALAEGWQQYHRENARLRVVHKIVNLSIANRRNADSLPTFERA